MDHEIEKFLKENDGVASVSEVADVLEMDEGEVRRWARENGVRRVGSTFAFGRDAARALADDLLPGQEDIDGADDDTSDLDNEEDDDGGDGDYEDDD